MKPFSVSVSQDPKGLKEFYVKYQEIFFNNQGFQLLSGGHDELPTQTLCTIFFEGNPSKSP